MQELYKSGRYFFAISIFAFGVILFVSGDFMSGFLPVNPDMPGRKLFLYLSSTLLLVAGLGLLVPVSYKHAARFTGYLLLLFVLYPHLPWLLSDVHNPGPWTSIAENIALCGGAFMISGSPGFFKWGKIMFAGSLIVFAIQHFMYADFIGTLIPAWIPAKVFLAYFIGLAFLLSSISILTNIKTRLACSLLGFMFLFWVIFLHAPRAFTHSHVEAEWTSLFIALAFSGIFFFLAAYGTEKTLHPKS
jgi:uncharacterized membrane protein